MTAIVGCTRCVEEGAAYGVRRVDSCFSALLAHAQAAYACSMQLCTNEDTDQYVKYFMHRINLLRHFNVVPIVVLDGGQLPIKSGENRERSLSRQENRERGLQLMNVGNLEQAMEYFQRGVEVTSVMAHKLVKALRLEEVEVIVAPYEADAQLAYLSRIGYVNAVISEDSDLLPYGCEQVMFKMDKNGMGREIVYANLRDATELNLKNFTPDMFLCMCILSGCDYLKSLPGMGIKRACKALNRGRNMRNVFRSMRTEMKMHLSPQYEEEFNRALLTFKHQRVSCVVLLCSVVHWARGAGVPYLADPPGV